MANGGNPNANPKCGSQISIRNPTSGQTVQATVVDTCVGCAMYDIDVSLSVFQGLEGGLTAGRVPVDWGARISFPWAGSGEGGFLARRMLTVCLKIEFQGQTPNVKEWRRKRDGCWSWWIGWPCDHTHE